FDFNEKDFDEFKKEIFDQIVNKADKDIMVVLNTINSCKDLYECLKEKFSKKYGLNAEECIDRDGICNFPNIELINMSTHVLPNFRLNRINRIKNDKKRKIIITTQLIEAGVDISVDIIYRDFAPLDCIIQTAGRCNRNNKQEKGMINVTVLKDENNKPFYSYIYDSTLIDVTKEVIEKIGKNVSEKDFTMKAADGYYNLVVERGFTEDPAIIDHLKKLEFSDTSEFKLIKNELPAVSIFVEINEGAKETRIKMEEILREKKGFEKREKLLEMRRNISSFTLSINCSKKLEEKIGYLPSVGEMEDFRYIPKEDLDKWYKLDVGFQPPKSNIDMIIL
ncbi:MAG: helicase-related protein, partial [Candidatus Thermoplasmatota archaeon]|nr:helicase-related protein [Candidatus Thermoplasmatota archaeon]